MTSWLSSLGFIRNFKAKFPSRGAAFGFTFSSITGFGESLNSSSSYTLFSIVECLETSLSATNSINSSGLDIITVIKTLLKSIEVEVELCILNKVAPSLRFLQQFKAIEVLAELVYPI